MDLANAAKGAQLWAISNAFTGLLILGGSLARKRMSHNNGVVAAGKIRVVDRPEFPAHDFLRPGREFGCRLRHASVSFMDDTVVQVRAASLKFADDNLASPLDIAMNTGRMSLFWSVRTFLQFASSSKVIDDTGFVEYYRRYPQGTAAAWDSIRDPTSFTKLYYHSQTPQLFIGDDGVERYVKFRLIPADRSPETGLIDPAVYGGGLWKEVRASGETRSPTYLREELATRLTAGPVKYILQLHLHTPAPADPPDVLNSNKAWDPKTHPFLDVAEVELSRLLPFDEGDLFRFSVSNCPPSLRLPQARSIDDYNSLLYMRAKSAPAAAVRVFLSKILGPPAGFSPDWAPPAVRRSPCLPQHDADPGARAAALAEARQAYQYDDSKLAPAVLAKAVPPADQPCGVWVHNVADAVVTIAVNSALIRGEEHTSPHHPKNVALRASVASTSEGAMGRALDAIQKAVVEGDTSGRAPTPADFDRLFREIKRPVIASEYQHNRVFARLRVAGPNPLQLHRIDKLDDRFPVTDAQYKSAMGEDDSLAAAGAEGRLYMTDYSVLDGVPCGTLPTGQKKFLAAPLGLFAVSFGNADKHLRPVAIQLAPRPGPDAPVVGPADGALWTVARMFLNVADYNIHQAVRHLGHTHLVMEPIALATRRCLPPRHPLAVLLLPHFEGTLYINEAAIDHLLADGGIVDTVMAARIDANRSFAAKSASEWSFDDAMLPNTLKRLGVDDTEKMPYHPYRDDASLLWKAIRDWVEDYVRLYYTHDGDVQADTELQAWAAEVCSPSGGRVKGFGQAGKIATLEYLASAVAHIVFTASVQHTAVNAPQYSTLSTLPASPFAAYGPPPGSKQPSGEDPLTGLLPPLDVAHLQLSTGYLLGALPHTRLGHYHPNRLLQLLGEDIGLEGHYFRDARVRPAVVKLQQRLADIEQVIHERNLTRIPYETLLPSQIHQSIDI